jgi:predicted PurR-regulated permease PerM
MQQSPHVTVQITPGSVTRGILVILLFYALFLIRDIVLVVLTAVVFASAIEPFTKWFKKRGFARLPAVIVIYLLIAAVFASIVYFFLPVLLNDFSGYVANLPKYLNYAQAWLPVKDPDVFANSQTLQQISSTSFSLSQSLVGLSDSLSNVSEGFVRTVSFVFGGVLSFVLIVVLSFYLAVQEDGISDFLRLVTPRKHERYVIDLWKRSQEKIGFWMQGQLLLGVTVGVLVYLALTIAGLQHALLLAILAGFFELIPVFGPILSAIPGVLTAVADKGAGFALIVAAIYLAIQQFENHIFYPLVVKKIIGISPIVVILALVVGGKLAGFLGVLLAIPLSTALMEFVNDVQKDRMHDGEALYKTNA